MLPIDINQNYSLGEREVYLCCNMVQNCIVRMHRRLVQNCRCKMFCLGICKWSVRNRWFWRCDQSNHKFQKWFILVWKEENKFNFPKRPLHWRDLALQSSARSSQVFWIILCMRVSNSFACVRSTRVLHTAVLRTAPRRRKSCKRDEFEHRCVGRGDALFSRIRRS